MKNLPLWLKLRIIDISKPSKTKFQTTHAPLKEFDLQVQYHELYKRRTKYISISRHCQPLYFLICQVIYATFFPNLHYLPSLLCFRKSNTKATRYGLSRPHCWHSHFHFCPFIEQVIYYVLGFVSWNYLDCNDQGCYMSLWFTKRNKTKNISSRGEATL